MPNAGIAKNEERAPRRTTRRDFLLLAIGLLLVLAIAGSVAGCASRTETAPAAPALALDFIWPRAQAPTISRSLNPPPPPRQVILHWNPKDYSHAEIAQIAGQQCLTFDRQAEPADRAARRASDETERFTCARMTAKDGSVPRG